MAQYPATGQWAIYSVQKDLDPNLGQANHNFLVLVDPQGNAVLEMQGVFSENGLTYLQLANGTAGNFLQVKMYAPNQYLPGDKNYTPVLVAQGSESTILSAFNTAYNAVATALNTNQDLYAAYPINPLDDAYNSNSVWYTAMLSLQASLPTQVTNPISSYNGPNSDPGGTLDLATAGSNNPIVSGGGTDTSYPTSTSTPPLPTVDKTYGSSNPTINLSSAGGTGYFLGVMNQAKQIIYYVASSDMALGSADAWSDMASQVGTFSSGAITITGSELQKLNGAIGGTTTLTPGSIVYVPTSESTSIPSTSSNETYVYDPTAGVYYTVTPNFTNSDAGHLYNETSSNTINFAPNTFSSASLSSGSPTITLSYNDPFTLGPLAINTSANTGTLTLADGYQINLTSIPTNADITTVSSSDTPEEALISYLGDLGDTVSSSTLNTDNFDYLNPAAMGSYSVTGTPDDDGNVNFTSSDGDPGATITGLATTTKIVGGTPTTVTANNILTASGDLSQDDITGIQVLNVESDVTLLGDQFNSFTTIEGSGTITISQAPSVGGDAFDLSAVSGTFNLTAQNWDGTTLTDNNANDETLTASLFGNDTLKAGNGTGDTLVAGEGVDTLTGGTGSGGDTFEALNGLADGSTVTGNNSSGADTLEASGDISGATIGGVGTLTVDDDVTLTASQLSGFTTINGGDTIDASGAGTYSLSGNTNFFDMYADPTADTTLIGGTAADELLSADGTSGNDVLEAGSGNGDEVSAAGSTGDDTLSVGNGTGDILTAGLGVDSLTGGNGGDTFEATDGLASGSSVTGGSGTDTLDADGDISGASVSGVETLNIGTGGDINLTASQLSGFTTVEGSGEIDAASAGTYSLSGNSSAIDMFADLGHVITLTGGTADDQTLNADDSTSSGDTLTAGSGASDTVSADGSTGANTLGSGSGEFDTLSAVSSSGNNTITAGAGEFDIVDVDDSSGANTLGSGVGEGDELSADGSSGDNTITSGNGASDYLSAIDSLGANHLTAGSGAGDSVVVDGSSGNNILATGNGNGDELSAEDTSGTNTLTAGTGTGDILSALGSTGDNTLNASSGGDYLYAGNGADTLNGGTGNDQFYLTSNTTGADITGGGGTNALIVDGATDITGVTISGVTELADTSSTLQLTGSQFDDFTTLYNPLSTADTLVVASSGTYSLTGDTITGPFTLETDDSSGGTVVDGGSGDSIEVAGNGMSGTTDQVDMSSGTVTVATNARSDVFGGSDTITGTTDDLIGVQSGNDDTVTVGSGSDVYLNGGEGHVVNAADGDFVQVAGNGTSGTTDQVYMSDGTIDVSNNARMDLFGGGNYITAGENDTIGIQDGDADIITIGSGTNLWFNGGDAHIVAAAAGDVVFVAGNGSSGDTDTEYMSSGTVNIANDARADIVGGSNTIDAGTSDSVGVQGGNDDSVSVGSSSGVWLNNGEGHTVSAASGDSVYVAGNGSSGTTDTIDLTSGTVTMGSSANATISGSSNTITASSSDTVTISSGANTLEAGTGGDVFDNSGSGSNTYEFNSGFGSDTINNATSGGSTANGTAAFLSGIDDEDLWFTQSGNNLVIDEIDSSNQLTIDNWYSTTGNQLSSFTADGKTLDSSIASLVAAMATYASANPSFNPATAMAMPTDTTLQTAITSAWHA
jgi:hypothetical protein